MMGHKICLSGEKGIIIPVTLSYQERWKMSKHFILTIQSREDKQEPPHLDLLWLVHFWGQRLAFIGLRKGKDMIVISIVLNIMNMMKILVDLHDLSRRSKTLCRPIKTLPHKCRQFAACHHDYVTMTISIVVNCGQNPDSMKMVVYCPGRVI